MTGQSRDLKRNLHEHPLLGYVKVGVSTIPVSPLRLGPLRLGRSPNPSAVVRISRAGGLPLATLVDLMNPEDGYGFDSLQHTWGGNTGSGPATIGYTMRTEHAVGHALDLILDFN